MKKSIFLGLTAFILAQTAHAFPMLKRGQTTENLPLSFTTSYNFEGIVALDDCSGSLVRLETSLDTDPALVMTNGHCLETGMPAAGTFVSNQPSSREIDLFDSGANTVASLIASEVVYSTMTKTDVTIYKLTETYADIASKYNVHALTLASHHPALNAPIDVISGFWKRGYTCSIELFVNTLKEDQWTMVDSMRYSRPGCDTIGGTSGSPVVMSGTRTMIGINNTGNENGEQCTMDNPCEVDASGNITAIKGYSYGQETNLIYTCVNKNREIDLTVPGCQLPH